MPVANLIGLSSNLTAAGRSVCRSSVFVARRPPGAVVVPYRVRGFNRLPYLVEVRHRHQGRGRGRGQPTYGYGERPPAAVTVNQKTMLVTAQ